ncbi:hypothetical protein AGMMS50267_15260 [Spirochaetia bacterium]|nr:hypothetical protein AGMMS50267_15260 [Spirochaetia bacterium]
MKKVALNWRRIMRKVYTGLGLGAAALVFEACYGPFMVADMTITGVVTSEKTGDPIEGIQVLLDKNSQQEITDSTGQFWLPVPPGLGEYTLTFKDIDGEANGVYVSKTEVVDLTGGNSPLEIKLTDAE